MSVQVHPMAFEEWQTDIGVDNLLKLWSTMDTKPQTEGLIGEMVARCPQHDVIVDLGCGPGRLLTHMPKYKAYRGYDSSVLFIREALKAHGNTAAAGFHVRDIFDGAPYRKTADVLLAIDVAQHYFEPLKLLWEIVQLWPARYYIFTVLHAEQKQDLLNSFVVATADVSRQLPELGIVVEQHDVALEKFAPLIMRYVTLETR